MRSRSWRVLDDKRLFTSIFSLLRERYTGDARDVVGCDGMAVPGNRKYFTLNLVYAVSVIETPSRITRSCQRYEARPLRSRGRNTISASLFMCPTARSPPSPFLRVFGNLRRPTRPYADQVSLCELPMSLIHVHRGTFTVTSKIEHTYGFLLTSMMFHRACGI